MQLNDFITQLESLKPSSDLLLKNGFTNIPNDITKNYVLDRKREAIGNYSNHGIISELFHDYDTQYISFGDFNFYKEIKSVNNYFIFAGSSDSELVFENPYSEVVEYDREEWSVLTYCAKDTEAFLKALLPLFDMYSLRLQKLISRKDNDANVEYLEKCIQAAGGSKYKRFYKNIIG
jgi:hypothetical protein